MGDLDSLAAPQDVTAAEFAQAMIADVAEVLHDMSGVDSLVLCRADQGDAVRSLVWADVPVLTVEHADVRTAVAAAAARSYAEVVVVTPDVPDLPQMILAKMFQALATSPVTVSPADGGGAVAVGVALPAPEWLAGWLDEAGLDEPGSAAALRVIAPRSGAVRVTPGWHRLRVPSDVHRLDPGLEGWESTRELLTRVREA